MFKKNSFETGLRVEIFFLLISFIFCIYPSSADESKQILAGQVSVFRSLEVYVKGIYKFSGLFAESAEVDGDLYQCEAVHTAQFSCKADGYLRFYIKTKIPEFKGMTEEIIDRLHKVYKSTKTKDGKNWLPTQSLVSDDGKFYPYSKGKRFTRWIPHPIPYDQSQGKYFIKSADFPDAFGIGILQLSENANYLSEDHRKKLVEILEGVAEFWNSEYMVVKIKDSFYYRTEDISPANPTPQKDKISWGCQASDIIYSVKTLYNLGVNTDKYDENLTLFLKTYLSERDRHSSDFRIDYLDDRVLELSEYFNKKSKNQDLTKRAYVKLKVIHEKSPEKAVFMFDGITDEYSTIPFLEIYRKLGLKDKFVKLWKDIWDNNFDDELGIKILSGRKGINGSAYSVLLDQGYHGWKEKMLTDEEFIKEFKRYYMFKGNPKNYRDLDDWVIETGELLDGKVPNWTATPYDCYPSKIETEHYYGYEPQGYTTDRIPFGEKSKEREARECNIYTQYVAPYEIHAEKSRYGKAMSFNLLDTSENPVLDIKDNKQNKDDKIEFKVKFKYPENLAGFSCMGIIDVTEMYYENKVSAIKEGYQITKVICGNEEIPFEISHMLAYEEPFSVKNRARLCFLATSKDSKNKEGEIQIIAEKIKFPYYYEQADIKKSAPLKEPEDLQYYKMPSQEKTYKLEYYEAEKWLKAYEEKKVDVKMKDIVYKYWLYWVLAYQTQNKKNPKVTEKHLQKYLKILKYYLDLEKTTNAEAALRLNEITKFYSCLKNEIQKDAELNRLLNRRFVEDVKYLLENPSKKDSVALLEESKGLIRYGILFPTREKSKEAKETGFNQIVQYLKGNINEEGMEKNKETVRTARILIEVIRLSELNKQGVPKEIIKTLENITEFLMYVSNPDGTVSNAADNSGGENIREIFYWTSKITKRKDFRFTAFGGLSMENSFEPEKTSISFPKSGIYVMRNGWDIRDRYKRPFAKYKDNEKRQAVYLVTQDGDSISCYNRTLTSNQNKQNVKKWVSSGKYDYLKTEQKDGTIKEILYIKPNYWIVRPGKEYSLEKEFKLINQVKDLQKNVIRSENKYEVGYLYQLLKKGKGEVMLQEIDREIYLIYCYHNDIIKSRMIELGEKYKKKEGETIVACLQGKGVPPKYMKMMPLVPEIKIYKEESGKIILENAGIEKLEISKYGEMPEVIVTAIKSQEKEVMYKSGEKIKEKEHLGGER